jgi:hypothetical protein
VNTNVVRRVGTEDLRAHRQEALPTGKPHRTRSKPRTAQTKGNLPHCHTGTAVRTKEKVFSPPVQCTLPCSTRGCVSTGAVFLLGLTLLAHADRSASFTRLYRRSPTQTQFSTATKASLVSEESKKGYSATNLCCASALLHFCQVVTHQGVLLFCMTN